MKDWRAALSHHLRLSAAATEELIDAARYRLATRLGTNQPRCICAYRGFASADRVSLTGRVLAHKTPGEPRDQDSLWQNLLNTYRRFETDEVPHVPVTIRFEEQEQTVRTDEEGYYHCEIPRRDPPGEFWLVAEVRCAAGENMIRASHEIMAPGPAAEFGVISDLDDTVIETNVTSILTAAKLTRIDSNEMTPAGGVRERQD